MMCIEERKGSQRGTSFGRPLDNLHSCVIAPSLDFIPSTETASIVKSKTFEARTPHDCLVSYIGPRALVYTRVGPMVVLVLQYTPVHDGCHDPKRISIYSE